MIALDLDHAVLDRAARSAQALELACELAERIGGEVAERLYARGICLPSSSNMSEAEQDRVIGALRRAVGVKDAAA